MNVDIVKVLKNPLLFALYFDNRNYILLFLILLSVIISSYMIKKHLKSTGYIEYKTILGKTLSRIIIAIIIGTGLNSAGLEFKFGIDHMPILLVSSALVIIIGATIAECVRYYRNFKLIIKRTNIIFIGIIECVILLLSIMGRLEFIELIAAITGHIAIQIANVFIDSCASIQFENSTDINILREDYPVEQECDLFDSRKRQLNNICKELNTFAGEPFAVAITGEWGSGKTSLMNALKEKLDQAEFVNVKCSIEYDAQAVLKELSSQIQEIYKKNGVYVEKNGIIEKYFTKIEELVTDAGYGGMAKVVDKFRIKENGSYLENKTEMNKELDMFYRLTNKRIYFIVDDMDRVIDGQMRAILFQVIRESIELNNCVTLFMIDYDRLISECMSKEFLEKYVNRQFELCNLEFGEIVSKYEETYLTNCFWQQRSDYISEKGKLEKRNIIKNAMQIISAIQSEIKHIKENNSTKEISEEEKESNQEHIEYLLDAEERLLNRINNPRKVKRYLNNIEKMLSMADMVWFQNQKAQDNEYSKENWVKVIFEVAFLKTFLYEEYDELIKVGSVYLFLQNKKQSYITGFIISGLYSVRNFSGTEKDIIELVVYRLYALDINIDKTEHQRLIEELDGGALQEEKLNLYVNECIGINFNYDRTKKVLEYLEKHDFRDIRYKCKVITNIMSVLSKSYNLYASGLYESLERMKSIIGSNSGNFTAEERAIIEGSIDVLQSRIISSNNSNIRALLSILNNEGFDELFEHIYTITQLHDAILKIDEMYPLSGFIQSDTEIETLINYFKRMEDAFNDEAFLYARDEILYFLKKVSLLLEILKIWFWKEEEKTQQYYDNMQGEFKQIVLENENNLISGLDEFEKYILACQKDEKVMRAFINLLYKIEMLDKNNPNYWEENRSEVIVTLENIYGQLQQNQTLIQKYEGEWKFAKIRLFRLRRNSLS